METLTIPKCNENNDVGTVGNPILQARLIAFCNVAPTARRARKNLQNKVDTFGKPFTSL